MDDELELTDPEHPDAQEAATATARLLIAIHEQRHRQPTREAVPRDGGEQACPST